MTVETMLYPIILVLVFIPIITIVVLVGTIVKFILIPLLRRIL